MKKITKKTLFALGISIPLISVPIATLLTTNNVNVKNNVLDSNINSNRASESYEYYNYDTTILNQNITNINIENKYDVNNPSVKTHQILSFTYNFDFRDYVPDKGHEDVFLQLTKLDFLFDDLVMYSPIYKPNSYIIDRWDAQSLPLQFNFNYNDNNFKIDNNVQGPFGIEDYNNKNTQSFISTNSSNNTTSSYQFPLGDYHDKQFEFKINPNWLYHKLDSNVFWTSSNNEPLNNIINTTTSTLTVLRNPIDISTGNRSKQRIQFNFKLVTNTNYFFTKNIQGNIQNKPFKLKIASNYFVDSTSNIVYDKLVVAGNLTSLWNPLNDQRFNKIFPKLTNQQDIKINYKKIKVSGSKPVINLNNIYLNNQTTPTYNLDMYVANAMFGKTNMTNRSTGSGDWAISSRFPVYINLNINPATQPIIHVNQDIQITKDISLNVKFDLKQDQNDPLKYYLYDVSKPDLDVKNNGEIQLCLSTTNPVYVVNDLSSSTTPKYGLAIANNFKMLTIYNPNFSLREIIKYMKSSINHDIVFNYDESINHKAINPDAATQINSQSNLVDVFDDTKVNGKLSNKQLVINEINQRVEGFYNLPSVKTWINDNSIDPKKSFYPLNIQTQYKKLNNQPPLVNNYYGQGIVNVIVEPKQNNNYLFKKFEFSANVYVRDHVDWNQLISLRVNQQQTTDFFLNYYSYQQLIDDLNQGLNHKKTLLTNLVVANDHKISQDLFKSLIEDINLVYVDHSFVLSIKLNNPKYYFYDKSQQKYTNQIRIDLGKHHFKAPDKTYLIDLVFDVDKLSNTIHNNYSCLDDFINDYQTLDKAIEFFDVKSNKDKIESIKFLLTDQNHELKIQIKTKSGFEDKLYYVSTLNNHPDFEYDPVLNTYTTVVSNLVLKGQTIQITKLNFNLDLLKMWSVIHTFSSFEDFKQMVKNDISLFDQMINIYEVDDEQSSSRESSYQKYLKSIKVNIKLNPGYQYIDQSKFNLTKTDLEMVNHLKLDFKNLTDLNINEIIHTQSSLSSVLF